MSTFLRLAKFVVVTTLVFAPLARGAIGGNGPDPLDKPKPGDAKRAEEQRLKEEAEYIAAAEAARTAAKARNDRITVTINEIFKLPPDQIADAVQREIKREPANQAVVAEVVAIEAAKELGKSVGKKLGDVAGDVIDDVAELQRKLRNEALNASLETANKVKNEVLKAFAEQTEAQEKRNREGGVLAQRDGYQKAMIESRNWSKLHPDRQNEILKARFPDK